MKLSELKTVGHTTLSRERLNAAIAARGESPILALACKDSAGSSVAAFWAEPDGDGYVAVQCDVWHSDTAPQFSRRGAVKPTAIEAVEYAANRLLSENLDAIKAGRMRVVRLAE